MLRSEFWKQDDPRNGQVPVRCIYIYMCTNLYHIYIYICRKSRKALCAKIDGPHIEAMVG